MAPMRMSSFRIQSFKAIGDATIHWHPRVNVITGPNNSGKTTVLEALALWVEAFDRICKRARKSSTRNGIQRGQWYLDRASAHHSDVLSARSPGYDDLFHRGAKELFLTATFTDEDGEFALPIKIRTARGDNYDFSCATAPGAPAPALVELNPRLNRSCLVWPRPFRALFASPVAAVQTREAFSTPGRIEDMVQRRRSAEVLRNRIHRLHGRSNDFQRFTDDISQVLTGSVGTIEIVVRGDPNRDVWTQVLARNSGHDRLRDISLLGSGSLQIIEILLTLYLEPSDLNLVLLDEPDSHIHRDIQRRLLELIEDKAKGAQVFATTHNESLLRNAGWDRVFHLTPAPVAEPKVFRAVAAERVVVEGRQHGLLASPLRNAMSSIGAETTLDLLNALEAKHFLLVEGGADAVLLQRSLELGRLGGPAEQAMYWSLNGIEGLRSLPALRTVLSEIRNSQSLWTKARLILDRDLLTAQHASAITKAFARPPNKLRVSFWDCRTAESVLLSGGPSPALAQLLVKMAEHNGLAGLKESRAQASCVAAWKTMGKDLTVRWGAKLQPGPLLGELEQRYELIKVVLPGKTPLGGSTKQLANTVCNYHRQEIKPQHYWHSAGKKDVSTFMANALQGMGVKAETARDWSGGPNWFEALIAELDRAQDFPALQTMRQELGV